MEAILSAFGVSLSRMSSWRDVQAGLRDQEGEALAAGQSSRRGWGLVAWARGNGSSRYGKWRALAIGMIDEKDMKAVMRW